MRKLTPDYFFKQMIRSKSPAELFKASTQLGLYWVDHWSYQLRTMLHFNK